MTFAFICTPYVFNSAEDAAARSASPLGPPRVGPAIYAKRSFFVGFGRQPDSPCQVIKISCRMIHLNPAQITSSHRILTKLSPTGARLPIHQRECTSRSGSRRVGERATEVVEARSVKGASMNLFCWYAACTLALALCPAPAPGQGEWASLRFTHLEMRDSCGASGSRWTRVEAPDALAEASHAYEENVCATLGRGDRP